MSAGIVTLTPAGAIDATYRIGMLERGAFVRASSYDREVSGKGVNVAAALRLAGGAVAAVVVLGEDDLAFAQRSPYADMLRVVPVPGATRVNTSVIDGGRATTKVNAPTPPIPREAWASTREAVRAAGAETSARWLVISGTLPAFPGESEPVALADVIRDAVDAGVRVALDTSGAALARTAVDPHGIALMKPNTLELAELVGRPLRTIGEVTDAARELVARGVETVYTSMGADGVLVVSASTVVHAHASARDVVNTAGAGDASLAGFLVGLGDADPRHPEALAAAAATAAAWGAHAVAQPTTILPDLADLPAARVTRDPDPATPLAEPAG
ncbi:1-phosphofructokinase family hexose kinase [Microbacterium sp. MEC084]|uniref:1-phosphofructokinase family hexose kinase n=1 Tax=Microbacterium sp. MEC084 TaxID=1963027 RepID=UPI00106FE3BD|nr:PfkB family carbohydrate kinase [Microbacterium sp. MEC084]MCD1269923.1 1-phosphofructokinase family hexose kinase [Microbacterium sp. MEC084]